MVEQINNDLESGVEYPDRVYINLEKNTAPIAVTLPNNPSIQIPQDPSVEPSGEISLVVEAPGMYRRNILTPKKLLNRIRYIQHSLYTALNVVLEADTEEKFSINEYKKLIERMLEDSDHSGKALEYFRNDLKELEKRQNELELVNPSVDSKILGALYEGEFVPFEKLSELKAKIDEPLALFSKVGPQEGKFLYRAVDKKEYENILRDKGFVIRTATQFEDQLMYDGDHSQVKNHAKMEGYSGKIIRLKVKGPYFMSKGMAAPRVESQAAHFAEVEVLNESGDWEVLK